MIPGYVVGHWIPVGEKLSCTDQAALIPETRSHREDAGKPFLKDPFIAPHGIQSYSWSHNTRPPCSGPSVRSHNGF